MKLNYSQYEDLINKIKSHLSTEEDKEVTLNIAGAYILGNDWKQEMDSTPNEWMCNITVRYPNKGYEAFCHLLIQNPLKSRISKHELYGNKYQIHSNIFFNAEDTPALMTKILRLAYNETKLYWCVFCKSKLSNDNNLYYCKDNRLSCLNYNVNYKQGPTINGHKTFNDMYCIIPYNGKNYTIEQNLQGNPCNIIVYDENLNLACNQVINSHHIFSPLELKKRLPTWLVFS
jgi:hypothetical protein